MNFKLKTWKWKDSDNIGYGFIAHEYQEEVPYGVCGKKDELDVWGEPLYQFVDYSSSVPFLVGAVQEMHRRVLELEAKIRELTANNQGESNNG